MTTQDKAKAQMEGLATLLILNDEIRKVNTLREFGFFTTNETHRLIPYHTAFLWQKKPSFGIELLSQSGTPEIDIHTITNQWLLAILKSKTNIKNATEIHQVNLNELDTELINSIQHNWKDIFPPYLLWCPLLNKSKELTGGLLFFREQPFSQAEIKMIGWLIASYQYTWSSLNKSHRFDFIKTLKKKPLIIGIILILLFPIRLSVLGTATVVAADPVLINAPLEGIIKSFSVNPGESVHVGQVLFSMDKTDLESDVDVARKEQLLTEAKLRTAINQGIDNAEVSAEVPILKAQLAIDSARINYSTSLLEKTIVKSPIEGIVVFNSKEDWVGQPVKTGERILVVTDPTRVELKISIPITNIIDIDLGNSGDFFVYGQFESMAFKISTLGYNAKLMPNRVLAYEFKGRLTNKDNIPQLGAQGTARVYGQRVPLIYYLIRRPLQAMRQSFGI